MDVAADEHDALDRFGAEEASMRPGFKGGYDVRGWGHTYALWFLLQLRARDAVPEGLDA